LALERLEDRQLLTLTFDPSFIRADPFCLAHEYDPGHVNVIVPGEGNVVVRQPDGKLLIGGKAFVGAGDQFGLVRINENGSLDMGFGVNGVVKVPYFDGTDEVWCWTRREGLSSSDEH
jgi:hypothetical protein